jgi:hypothetical protein
MYENRVLREIFGPMREEVKGDWRKLHNEKLISLPNIRVTKSRRRGWVGHVARMEQRTGAYRVLVGKPEGKRPHGRPWRRWEDDITMHVKEIVREGMDWTELDQDRDKCWAVVNTVMNFRVSSNAGNFLASRRTSVSKSAMHRCVRRFNDQTAHWIMRVWNLGRGQAIYLFSKRRDWLGGPGSLTFQGTEVLCPALQRPGH